MNEKLLWWKQPLRVIQTNLQVMDTPRMDPAKIAREIEEMGGNVLVTNVGGIYAWYPSQVPLHCVNPMLPRDFDLLEALIEECHKRNIRLVARYDFSKAYDKAYQLRPQWFLLNEEGKPKITGATRPGEWDLLYDTCVSSGYVRDELALPVLEESLRKYDIDGVFFNAPHPRPCHCDNCKRKYREYYGEELPDDTAQMRPDWGTRIMREYTGLWYDKIKEIKPDAPMILYYSIANDNLYDRLASCDMICAEPQDVLSLGWRYIPQNWKPAMCIRLGRSEPGVPEPFGIIHSCPGMDWRHTGLPTAEYDYWLSQVPANGGQIWHSITGFCDTITDKRILNSVSRVNHDIMKVEKDMHGAQSTARVALLWSMKGKDAWEHLDHPAQGWAEALMDTQIPFDMILREQVLKGYLNKYRVLVVPRGVELDDAITQALKNFVGQGGRLLFEGVPAGASDDLLALMGIKGDFRAGESLVASYLRFEEGEEPNPLQKGLEHTPIIAHRGVVQYVTPLPDTRRLATLVPPFAPYEAVGAPPERASIPHPYSDLPLCLYHPVGQGGVMLMPFEVSMLVATYKLAEHLTLVSNAVRMLLGEDEHVACTPLRGLQLMAYEKEGVQLVHLVNGIGQRPLANNVPLHQIEVRLRWNEGQPPKVTCLLGGGAASVQMEDGWAVCVLDRLDVWEVLRFEKV